MVLFGDQWINDPQEGPTGHRIGVGRVPFAEVQDWIERDAIISAETLEIDSRRILH